jgi:gliding motility-associated-like protein/uncharacterized repeat protein (TIGR01451 family)
MTLIHKRGIAIFLFILLIRVSAFSQGSAGGTATRSVEITQGSFVTFKADAANGITYQWYKDGMIISGAVQQTLQISEPGIYAVVAFNGTDCSSVLSDPIEVTIKQTVISNKADVLVVKKSDTRTTTINDAYEYEIRVTNKGPDTATEVVVTDAFPEGLVLKDVSMTMLGKFDYDASKRTLTWTIDELSKSQTSEIKFRTESINPGVVENTAKVKAAETDPDQTNNESTDKKLITDIIVPNVFTPNGDGVNDNFEIKYLDLYKENEISIINRWGNSVYEKKDYKNAWDGYGLDEGTYFYVLKVKNASGSWKVFKGYVTLLRTKTQ